MIDFRFAISTGDAGLHLEASAGGVDHHQGLGSSSSHVEAVADSEVFAGTGKLGEQHQEARVRFARGQKQKHLLVRSG
jgi:hypothetical protein